MTPDDAHKIADWLVTWRMDKEVGWPRPDLTEESRVALREAYRLEMTDWLRHMIGCCMAELAQELVPSQEFLKKHLGW